MTEAHGVAWLVCWQVFTDPVEDVGRCLHIVPNALATDGDAVKVHRCDSFGGRNAKVTVLGALDDAKEKLAVAVVAGVFFVFRNTTLSPAMRTFHGGRGVFLISVVRGALVKRHDDVGAEFVLDVYRCFGREDMFGTVYVRAKGDAVFGDLGELGVFGAVAFLTLFLEAEGEDLKTTTVSKHWAVPVHKFVHAAGLVDEVFARLEVEVVGVGEDDLCVHREELVRVQTFDGGLGPDGHEDRRLNVAMVCMNSPCAGLGVFVLVVECVHMI